jgi:hypothetical protein
MFEAIERVRAIEAAQSDTQTVPLLKILSDAENDEELVVSNG